MYKCVIYIFITFTLPALYQTLIAMRTVTMLSMLWSSIGPANPIAVKSGREKEPNLFCNEMVDNNFV